MPHPFFGIVNQVLVRLWARRLEKGPCERALSSCALALRQDAGIAKSDRPRSFWVATPGGIQPSDRRHMRSETLGELPVVMAGGSLCAS